MKPEQGKKAMFLNLREDGVRIRGAAFKNKAKYERKSKHKVTWE